MQDDELTQYEKEQLESLGGNRPTTLSDLVDEFELKVTEDVREYNSRRLRTKAK